MSTYKKQFFNKLANKLEKYFPKGKCRERSKALMLNSYANIYFEDFLIKAVAEEKKNLIGELLPELYLIRANIPLTWGKVSRIMFKELLNKLEKLKN